MTRNAEPTVARSITASTTAFLDSMIAARRARRHARDMGVSVAFWWSQRVRAWQLARIELAQADLGRRSVVCVRHRGAAERAGRTKSKGSLCQLPCQYSPWLIGLAAIGLPRSGKRLDRSRVLAECDETIAIQQP